MSLTEPRGVFSPWAAAIPRWCRVGVLVAVAAGVAACGDDPAEPANEAPTIILTSPNTSIAYAPGASVSITWSATDDEAVTGVDLSYTADFGESGTIATGEVGTSFAWTLPMEDLFGVRVKAVARDVDGLTGEDESDEVFAVVETSDRGYVTSSVCQSCHTEQYDDLFDSGHPYKLNEVVGGTPPTYPFSTVPNPPTGFTWNDISYVIGGYGWKARFMDQDGFILVTGVVGEDTQYNLPRDDLGGGLPSEWTAYHAGDRVPKPYTCGTCHTTGWQTTAENGGVNQDGRVGIAGTWEETGVTCEQCHGPGEDHVAAKSAAEIDIQRGSELCGSCHFRDTNHGVLASGGFIRHHEQYDELIAAGHRNLGCVGCHDPHIGVRYDHAADGGIVTTCESCHSDKTTNSHVVPLECIDCHMPRAGKSARAVQAFQGDVRTHIFALNSGTETRADMFYEQGGSTYSRNFVTLDFACYGCHTDPLTMEGGGRSEQSMAALSTRATGIHN